MRIKIGESIRPSIGTGVHEVKITNVLTEYDVETNFGKKDLFIITYESTQGKPKTITQRYIAYYDETSAFGKVVDAVLGGLPSELDTSDLIGKPCKITVEAKRSKQGKLFHNVTNVEPSDKPSVMEAAEALFEEML